MAKDKYEGPNTEAEDRMRQIYERLTEEHNMSDLDAKAIIANIKHETGHTADPKQKQHKGPAKGLVQWEGPRYRELQSFAQAKGEDPESLETQVDFIVDEMNNGMSWAKVKEAMAGAKTLREKIKAFSDTYERPGKPHMESRYKAGEDLEKSPYLNFAGAPSATTEATEVPKLDTQEQPKKKEKLGIMDRLKGMWQAGEDWWANSTLNEDVAMRQMKERAAAKTAAGKPAYTPEERKSLQAELEGQAKQTEQELAAKRKEEAVAGLTGEKQKIDDDKKTGGTGAMKPTVDLDTGEGKPEAVDDNLAKLETALANLPSGTLSEAEAKKWEDKIAEIRQRARAKASEIQSAELAEKLGHALSKMFAAMYGLRTGLDMSGVKFDKTDWDRRMNTAMSFIDEELGAAKAGRAAAEKAASEERAQARQALLDKFNMMKERRLQKAQDEASKRAGRELDLRERGLDIQEGKIAQKSVADKIKAAEKLDEKTRKELSQIANIIDDPKLDDEAKATKVGNLPHVQRTLTPEQIKTVKGGTINDLLSLIGLGEKVKTGLDVAREIKGTTSAPAPASPTAPAANEVKRQTEDGRTAIFDATTKKFLRYE